MLISRLYGHMSAVRSTKSVTGAHLIGGESRPASQSLSTRRKFGDQQYESILLIPEFCPGGQRQRLTLTKSTLLV